MMTTLNHTPESHPMPRAHDDELLFDGPLVAFGLQHGAMTMNPTAAAVAMMAARGVTPDSIADGLRKGLSGAHRTFRLCLERRRVERELGVSLPVDCHGFDDMMREVRRFKWLEAERAGSDIWASRGQDAERAATLEWFRRHFGAWYLHYSRVAPQRVSTVGVPRL